MDRLQFEELDTGDVIRGKASGSAFVVIGRVIDKDGHLSVIAVKQVTVTRPGEWDLIFKHNFDTPPPPADKR